METRLKLNPITLDEAYRKKWNITMNDFLILCRGDLPISMTLYRTGMMGGKLTEKYFKLIKYTEDFYEDSITKDKNQKPHLSGRDCILDQNGIEKYVATSMLYYPYIVENSCIFSVDKKYYNIETGEFYADSSSSFDSTDYLFIKDEFNRDASKRGVLKINKETGIVEFFK